MKKLILNPNISVGPFVFGTEQEEVWKIIKREFGSERDPDTERSLPAYEAEYYPIPDILLEFKNKKLLSVSFNDDISHRYCEIYLGNEKIWPRSKKKFFSIFGGESFVDVYGRYFHPQLSIGADWDDDLPSLLIGQEGYSTEMIETYRIFDIVESMTKMMDRKECRMLINRPPQISEDGRTDFYPYGVIKPEVTELTFDSNDKLIRAVQTFTDGDVLNISLKQNKKK